MRVLLVPNPKNGRSLEAAGVVAAYLSDAGHESMLTEADAEASGLTAHAVARSELTSGEFAVALGGDGTILKAVHLLGVSDVPVLGVNLGRLGFLSAASHDRLVEVVSNALRGDCPVEQRQTVEAQVLAGGRTAGCYRALNEVFVGRGAFSRGVELDVQVNDVFLSRFVCDGIVIATATGSTAYALSAGGPILSPGVRGMVLVPVAPHTLRARSLVLAPGDRVRVTPMPLSASEVCVAVDGDQIACRCGLDSVEVFVGAHDVRLMRPAGWEFYGTLGRTFFGA